MLALHNPSEWLNDLVDNGCLHLSLGPSKIVYVTLNTIKIVELSTWIAYPYDFTLALLGTIQVQKCLNFLLT